MKKYKVEIYNGVNYAPYRIIMAANENNAIKEARQNNGLARFDSWIFTAKEIKR